MKNPFQRGLKRVAHHWIPPRLLKYQIASRNWRRGEREIRYLDTLVVPGRNAIDVGAFLGAYTYFLAKLSPTVYAFEPQRMCCEFLRRAYRNNVRVYDCALSNYSGEIGMLHGADKLPNQGASLLSGDKSKNHQRPESAPVQVAVKRLDEFELDNIGFIKIDAEGEETNVLEGAEQTLTAHRPNLLIEIEQRHRQGDIYDVFRDVEAHGYHGEYLIDGEFRSLKTFSVAHHQHARLAGDKSKPYINNFVFRPN